MDSVVIALSSREEPFAATQVKSVQDGRAGGRLNTGMTDTTTPPSPPPFRLKFLPLLVTAALGYAVPEAGAYLAVFIIRTFHIPITPGGNVEWLYAQHAGQTLVALAVILVMKTWFVKADYGLHWPRGKTCIRDAVLWGTAFGVIMTVVDYFPQLLSGGKPDIGFPLTPVNIFGWTLFEGVYVGPTEEIPFRALLVTYLATTMPGKLRIARFEMDWAGIFVAIIFALLHATSFSTENWPQALGQQVYAFALGVLYAYWLEKSKSVVAPVIGHNVSDVVEYLILFAWLALLGH